MTFTDAVKDLQLGKKIYRLGWEDRFLQMDIAGEVSSFTLSTSTFNWANDIITSKNWIINDIEGCNFPDTIEAIRNGKKVRLKEWKDQYVILDQQLKCPVLKSYILNYFIPDYNDFISNDWDVME